MVYVLMAPGFEEAEALVPVDLLRRAGIEVRLVSIDKPLVRGGHGMIVFCDTMLKDVELEQADLIFLPGGGQGVENLGAEPKVEALVRNAAEKGVLLAAICAAPTLFCRWGFLEGRQAVCYPTWADRLTGAQFQPEAAVVQDGPFITGKAAGAAFEFGLKLVEVLASPEKAEQVKNEIYLTH